MADESKPGMQCTEFDALLTEVIDGTLNGTRREAFERHRIGCAACNTLFAEVTAGVAWLDEVVDIAPPRDLTRNIMAATLAATSGGPAARVERGPGVWERLRRRWDMVFAPVLMPRFAMSMGMAFFSIMLVLNMAEIRIKDLTAHNLSHTFYSSENKLMKYYENTRLAYEIESRVRELRNADQSEGGEQNRRPENNNQTQRLSEPERHEQREFSRDRKAVVLAALPGSEQGSPTYPKTNPEMVARRRRVL